MEERYPTAGATSPAVGYLSQGPPPEGFQLPPTRGRRPGLPAEHCHVQNIDESKQAPGERPVGLT